MRDPAADVGRRAWIGCERCADGAECARCVAGRYCERHWRYLLDTDGPNLFVQCPACLHRWWHDTGFGTGGRPLGLADLPTFPDVPGEGRAA
jgi:hypothetical protein